jgi:hypothetical protein
MKLVLALTEKRREIKEKDAPWISSNCSHQTPKFFPKSQQQSSPIFLMNRTALALKDIIYMETQIRWNPRLNLGHPNQL